MKISHFIETVLIFIVLTIFNYIFDPKNIFYPDHIVNIYLYILIIIALFYGIVDGIVFYFLYFGVIYLYYHKFYIEKSSHYFIFLIIFSEFMYYWNKKINKLTEENNYLKNRIEELGSAYYILKISHDELEKHYILKPYSIREILREIRNLVYKNSKESIKTFLHLLKKLFNIEKGALFLKEGDKFILKDYIGENIELKKEDTLIKNALQYQTTTYISSIHNSKSNFLAVIPILDLNKNFRGVFIIKEMPFFSLTKDNLITIELFLTYFINLLQTIKQYKEYKNPFFIKEILSLQRLSKKFDIDNYLIIFFTKNELEIITIQNKLRGADISYQYNNKLFVILPMTPISGVIKFCDKIKKDINIDYKIVNLAKASLEEIKKMTDDIDSV